MVVRQRPIESITTEGASPSSTTRFTAVVLRCSSVLWSSNRPSIFIGLNISNTYASVDYPSDAAVSVQLREKATEAFLEHLRGPMSNMSRDKLEDFTKLLLTKLGAQSVEVVARRNDIGADVHGVFPLLKI